MQEPKYIQKSVIFLYHKENSQNELKKPILVTLVSKKIKYSGILLTTEVPNYKEVEPTNIVEEIKDDLNKWKNTPVHGLEDLISL